MRERNRDVNVRRHRDGTTDATTRRHGVAECRCSVIVFGSRAIARSSRSTTWTSDPLCEIDDRQDDEDGEENASEAVAHERPFRFVPDGGAGTT
jgi:hypothetical protein